MSSTKPDLEAPAATLLPQRARRPRGLAVAAALGSVALIALAASSLPPKAKRARAAEGACSAPPRPASTLVYLGNGCFWERQWAYYNLEIAPPFGRPAPTVSSIVGYAGGRRPAFPGNAVCYHTNDRRNDYSMLGHAEARGRPRRAPRRPRRRPRARAR